MAALSIQSDTTEVAHSTLCLASATLGVADDSQFGLGLSDNAVTGRLTLRV